MAVDLTAVKQAESVLRANPTNENAAMFLSKLREAESEGNCDDDDFLDGLSLVEHYLWTGNATA